MKAAPLIVCPSQYPSSTKVLGVDITVLDPGDRKNGCRIAVQAGRHGAGPPPHRDEQDKTLYVLQGSAEMIVGGWALSCGAGTLVHVRAGTLHSFWFGAEGGKLLEITGNGKPPPQPGAQLHLVAP